MQKAYRGNTVPWNTRHRQKLANSLKIFSGDPLQDMEFWHRIYCNHNYNKILKSDWLSTAQISEVIGQYASCL